MSEPFVLELGAETHEFPVFTVPEYAALQGRIAASLKKQNRLIADEAGFGSQMDRARFLKEADPRSIGVVETDNFLNDDREARTILKQSLGKAGKTPDESEAIIAKLAVIERATLAKHVAGLIDLSPVPEKDREASELMRGAVRRHFPGIDVDKLTVGEFYNLISQLAPPEPAETVDGWFKKNSVAGTEKALVAA